MSYFYIIYATKCSLQYFFGLHCVIIHRDLELSYLKITDSVGPSPNWILQCDPRHEIFPFSGSRSSWKG